MLARRNRFSGRTSLAAVFRKGRATRHEGLLLRYFETKQTKLRVAVVVSRKVDKSAVVRNRIRRRVYDFVKRHQNMIKAGDLVISVFDANLAQLSFADFETVLTAAFKRAQLLS